MMEKRITSPWRILIPVGLGASLSLIGDSTLYVVLPTHISEVGVTLGSVGILLSANRFIRLVLNGPVAIAYGRWPHRPLFVLSLFIGASSTALYSLAEGFWLLLFGRLCWGLAWAGIWIGGNTIVLDMSQADNRGRWVGLYQISFFLGASSGALFGGLLTDLLGYRTTMVIGAAQTLLGTIVVLIFLPETNKLKQAAPLSGETSLKSDSSKGTAQRFEFASAVALLGVNRLVLAGVLNSTLSLFLLKKVSQTAHLAGFSIGVATLTGLGLGANTFIAMLTAPIAGELSDRWQDRWRVATFGLILGVAGFMLLAWGTPGAIIVGLPLASIAGGSNQGLSTALAWDLGDKTRSSLRLSWLFTFGDLTSAVGPAMAYALLPLLDLEGLYLLNAVIWGLMLIIAMQWSFKRRLA